MYKIRNKHSYQIVNKVLTFVSHEDQQGTFDLSFIKRREVKQFMRARQMNNKDYDIIWMSRKEIERLA